MSKYEQFLSTMRSGGVPFLSQGSALTYSQFIDAELNQCKDAKNYCKAILEIENVRLPDGNIWSANKQTLNSLDKQIAFQKELKSIKNFGLIQGTLKHFESEYQALGLSDSEIVVKSMARKLLAFFEKKYGRTNSVVQIGIQIMGLAKDLQYDPSVLKKIDSISFAWVELNNDLQTLSSKLESGEYSDLSVTADRILERGKLVYHGILSLENIREHILDMRNNDEGRFSSKLEPTRNETAISVLKQLKQKLEGRVVEGHTISISEHVSFLIEESISDSNLALMFEGWMAWI